MPQIGWFEILIIVVVAILVIGPKDFPVVLKKLEIGLDQPRDISAIFRIKLKN